MTTTILKIILIKSTFTCMQGHSCRYHSPGSTVHGTSTRSHSSSSDCTGMCTRNNPHTHRKQPTSSFMKQTQSLVYYKIEFRRHPNPDICTRLRHSSFSSSRRFSFDITQRSTRSKTASSSDEHHRGAVFHTENSSQGHHVGCVSVAFDHKDK